MLSYMTYENCPYRSHGLSSETVPIESLPWCCPGQPCPMFPDLTPVLSIDCRDPWLTAEITRGNTGVAWCVKLQVQHPYREIVSTTSLYTLILVGSCFCGSSREFRNQVTDHLVDSNRYFHVERAIGKMTLPRCLKWLTFFSRMAWKFILKVSVTARAAYWCKTAVLVRLIPRPKIHEVLANLSKMTIRSNSLRIFLKDIVISASQIVLAFCFWRSKSETPSLFLKYPPLSRFRTCGKTGWTGSEQVHSPENVK